MEDQDYRERLARDLAVWRLEGLISAEQERGILAHVGAGRPNIVRALRMGWLVTAVSIVGAIVLGAGVILLFAANWQDMPVWFRSVLPFVAMAAAYGAGYALMYRYDMQRIGSALLLLGALLYIAGLRLLAQIHELPVESAELALLAAIGIFPLAYAFGSRIIVLLAVGNLTIWIVTDLSERYDESPEFLATLLIIGVYGIALYAVGRLHSLRTALERFIDVYVAVGLLMTLVLVYVFTFDEPWDSMIDEGVESYAAPALVYVAIGISAALALAVVATRPRDVLARVDTAACLALLGIATVVSFWPAWTGYAIVFNGVYFAIVAGLVVRGYLYGDERYVNVGLLGVAVGLLTRYVDVFWSLLANSAFFIIGGVLLLAIAFALERLRRTLLASMPAEEGNGGAGGVAPQPQRPAGEAAP